MKKKEKLGGFLVALSLLHIAWVYIEGVRKYLWNNDYINKHMSNIENDGESAHWVKVMRKKMISS